MVTTHFSMGARKKFRMWASPKRSPPPPPPPPTHTQGKRRLPHTISDVNSQ